MSFSTVIGLVVLVVLMVAWVGVQGAWRKSFPGALADSDALAGRSGCHGCEEVDACRHRPAAQVEGAKEEIS